MNPQTGRGGGRIQVTLIIGLAVIGAGCRDHQTVASRSAAAYDEAIEKGVPVAGEAHGGHAPPEVHPLTAESARPGADPMDHGAMDAADHSRMGHGAASGMNHSQMEHGAATTMDHSQMQHGAASTMNHSQMQHGAETGIDHSGMQHDAATSMDHTATPGMAHGGATIPSGGLWGPVPGAHPIGSGEHVHPPASAPLHPQTTILGTAPAPETNQEMARLQPSITLRQDRVDLAAPVSVGEAIKAGGAALHQGHGDDAGDEPAVPHAEHATVEDPSPARDGEPATAYTCPMHPEIMSATPGSCPICGMTLVKKEQR